MGWIWTESPFTVTAGYITAQSADIKALSSTIIALIAAEKWRDNMKIEGNQKNITADEIRKAALEMINDMAQAADDNGKQLAIGYILGVGDLAKKVTEDDAE